MDRDCSGVINLGVAIQIYDMSTNAEFIAHKKTEEQILQELLYNFEGAKGNRDVQVT